MTAATGRSREIAADIPTLLYVEDDIATAQAFRTLMLDGGRSLNLMTVPDADAALELLAHKGQYAEFSSPDLIVLDLNLPRMNGFDLYTEIRALNLSLAPMILFTSARSAADRKRAMEMGFTAFVHKAADFDLFCQAIDQIYGLLMEAKAAA